MGTEQSSISFRSEERQRELELIEEKSFQDTIEHINRQRLLTLQRSDSPLFVNDSKSLSRALTPIPSPNPGSKDNTQASLESGEIFEGNSGNDQSVVIDDDNHDDVHDNNSESNIVLSQKGKSRSPLEDQNLQHHPRRRRRSSSPDPLVSRVGHPTPGKPANGKGAVSVIPSRQYATSAFADDRRQSFGKRPKPNTSGQTSTGTSNPKLNVPAWYQELKRDASKRPSGDSSNDVLLVTLKDFIVRASKRPTQAIFNEVRTRIHKLMFVKVDPTQLKYRKMLDPEGLPRLFRKPSNEAVQWPWDIKADAEELYNKWARQDFDTELLRGIIMNSNYGKLDKGWDRVDANFHGNGDLLNGQWWPTRLAVLRDGAHSETQAGISGAPGKGAYACVMSGGLDAEGKEYPDEDQGDIVFYCGTDSQDGKITAATLRMIESVEKNPVRLIRSSHIKSPFAPGLGYRYDGLYKVVSRQELDPTRRRYRFKLVREPGQDPLRGGTGPEKRPTAEEIEAWHKEVKMHKGVNIDA